MKKVFVLLGVLWALCFVACSNFQLTGGEVGSVSFTLGDDLAREIRSVASLRSTTGGTSYTVTAVLSGDYSEKSWITVDSGALAKATFSFENIPVGISVTLHLTVQAGNNLVWIGNSESHEVVAGNNSLAVTLGRVSGVLMWDNSSIKIAPYGNYEAGTLLSSTELPFPVWCFDNLGNLYWYIAGENAVIRSKLQADGTYSVLDGNYPGSADFLAYDNVSDSLYKMIDTEIIKAEESTGINLPEEVFSPVAFAVHDNIVYLVDVVRENDVGIPQIIIRNYNLGTSSLLKESSMYQLPTSLGTDPSYQMIYHEGALYLLLARVSAGSMYQVSGDDMTPEQNDGLAENYSLGAVLKINPDTLALDTSFGSDGYLGLSSSKTSFSGITETGYNITNGTVEYSGPDSSNDSSVFYGPQGFVAIMPKKLVIADAGFTMSKDGVQAKITKKSRIITVDLETLVFETESMESMGDSYYQPDIYSFFGSGYEYIKQEETSS